MHRSQGFTLLELTVIVIVIGLLVAIALPALQPARRPRGHQMGNTTHLVGIHKGMVLWSQDHKDRYPGIEADGSESPAFKATATSVGSGGRGGHEPAYRLAVLLNGNYFSPEYLMSPSETQEKATVTMGQELTSFNFSFAFLRLSDTTAKNRRQEWSATQNSRAAIGSDRNLGPAAGKAAQSNHTAPGDGWRGSVVYNDNHGNFETSNVLKTEYAQSGETLADDLFADDKDDAGNNGSDAAMVYHDASSYTNQK